MRPRRLETERRGNRDTMVGIRSTLIKGKYEKGVSRSFGEKDPSNNSQKLRR